MESFFYLENATCSAASAPPLLPIQTLSVSQEPRMSSGILPPSVQLTGVLLLVIYQCYLGDRAGVYLWNHCEDITQDLCVPDMN